MHYDALYCTAGGLLGRTASDKRRSVRMVLRLVLLMWGMVCAIVGLGLVRALPKP
jgi:hypothetical protein